MRSLGFRLMGAFVVVVMLGLVTNAVLIGRVTSGQFSRYVTQGGQLWAERIARTLSVYYARTGSWQGVENVLGSSSREAGNTASSPNGGAGMGSWGESLMGPGMMGRHEDLPCVFDRFFRAGRSRSRHTGGSGLGLVIVKQLVKAHGGNVWAASQPGRETTFFFTLPLWPKVVLDSQ